jgi:hypothetical protein
MGSIQTRGSGSIPIEITSKVFFLITFTSRFRRSDFFEVKTSSYGTSEISLEWKWEWRRG